MQFRQHLTISEPIRSIAIIFLVLAVPVYWYLHFSEGVLPDLVMHPVHDLQLKKTTKEKILLLFSTTYHNQGPGKLELHFKPTNQQDADTERIAMQRIFLNNGWYRDVEVGTYLWHAEHHHYHFDDFVEYTLEAVNQASGTKLISTSTKSSFCMRDVSKVSPRPLGSPEEVVYKWCTSLSEGVSVGWGDTYFADYPGQSIDVTGLPSGTYRLTATVNPKSRLQESNYKNNVSSVLFSIDTQTLVVKVINEYPKDIPSIEYVRPDNPF